MGVRSGEGECRGGVALTPPGGLDQPGAEGDAVARAVRGAARGGGRGDGGEEDSASDDRRRVSGRRR